MKMNKQELDNAVSDRNALKKALQTLSNNAVSPLQQNYKGAWISGDEIKQFDIVYVDGESTRIFYMAKNDIDESTISPALDAENWQEFLETSKGATENLHTYSKIITIAPNEISTPEQTATGYSSETTNENVLNNLENFINAIKNKNIMSLSCGIKIGEEVVGANTFHSCEFAKPTAQDNFYHFMQKLISFDGTHNSIDWELYKNQTKTILLMNSETYLNYIKQLGITFDFKLVYKS